MHLFFFFRISYLFKIRLQVLRVKKLRLPRRLVNVGQWGDVVEDLVGQTVHLFLIMSLLFNSRAWIGLKAPPAIIGDLFFQNYWASVPYNQSGDAWLRNNVSHAFTNWNFPIYRGKFFCPTAFFCRRPAVFRISTKLFLDAPFYYSPFFNYFSLFVAGSLSASLFTTRRENVWSPTNPISSF